MRISTEETDTAYVPGRYYMGTKIYLDGVEVRQVLTADDVAGYIKCAKLNENGDLYVVGDEVATEELHGMVRIELPLPSPD
jgi:hypothetical protein